MSESNNIVGASTYWHNLKDRYAIAAEKVKLKIDEITEDIKARRTEIVPVVDTFKYPIIDYPEFQKNRYINGRLIEAAMGMYGDKRLDIEAKGRVYKLLLLAKQQKKLRELEKTLVKYNKIVNLSYPQYMQILKTFYTEVQRQMILNGYGYVLEKRLGWICFNRVAIDKDIARPIDFLATRKRKERLLAEGKRIYNKEEADWCEKNGIKYEAEDVRVFKNDDHWYEFCLINTKIAGVLRQNIHRIIYRGAAIKRMTIDEIYEMTGGDKDKIMSLPLDMNTKLILCLKADKMLYTKFIRNENQTTSTYRETYRQDRQRFQHK